MKILLFILIFFVLFRLFVRYILPIIIIRMANKLSGNIQRNAPQQKRNVKPEGSIVIEKVNPKQQNDDFTDYEEIKS